MPPGVTITPLEELGKRIGQLIEEDPSVPPPGYDEDGNFDPSRLPTWISICQPPCDTLRVDGFVLSSVLYGTPGPSGTQLPDLLIYDEHGQPTGDLFNRSDVGGGG